jgi:hypothetical protein
MIASILKSVFYLKGKLNVLSMSFEVRDKSIFYLVRIYLL